MSDIGTTATSGFDFSPAKVIEFIRKSDPVSYTHLTLPTTPYV